jgi:hypothetical protein
VAILIGPVVALLGLVCLYFVLRTRAKTRTSLYTARRTLLQARTSERRQRALGGTLAGEMPAVSQAPVQASATAVAELAPTMVAPEAAAAPPPEPAWEQSPTRPQPAPPPPPPAPLESQPTGPAPNAPEAWPPAPPAPEPPPAPPPEAFPEPAMPVAAAPAAPTDWPSSTAQVEPPLQAPPGDEQVPVEPTMPAAEAPWAAEPNPAETFEAPPAEAPAFEPAAASAALEAAEPVAAEPGKPAWSIVGQGGEEISADALGAGTLRAEPKKGEQKGEQKEAKPDDKRAAWDVVPHVRGRHEDLNLGNLDEPPKETIGMTLLSYAGLVGALVVVLLGVLLMVATTR